MNDLEIREARAEGRSVAEAKAKILAELGLPEQDVKFFVLDEGRVGFLGLGRRPAVVLGQALVRTSARPDSKGGEKPRPEPRLVAAAEQERADVSDEPEAAVDPQVWQARAVDFVHGFLAALGEQAEVRAEMRGDTVWLSAQGELDWFCTGRSEPLDSLQFLCQLAVARQLGRKALHPRLVIDFAGYRDRRAAALREMAHEAAERVRQSGRPVRLEAMPASERRVVHMALQEEPGIITRSEGADPHRYVIVLPGRGTRPREQNAAEHP